VRGGANGAGTELGAMGRREGARCVDGGAQAGGEFVQARSLRGIGSVGGVLKRGRCCDAKLSSGCTASLLHEGAAEVLAPWRCDRPINAIRTPRATCCWDTSCTPLRSGMRE